MKICEFDMGIMKNMKTIEFNFRIKKIKKKTQNITRESTKIMKIIEFHVRITKIIKNHTVPHEKNENHEKFIIPPENRGNHENHKS